MISKKVEKFKKNCILKKYCKKLKKFKKKLKFNIKFRNKKLCTHMKKLKKTKNFLWTFASYDQKDEAYSDRNVYPIKCITKMEKLNV